MSLAIKCPNQKCQKEMLVGQDDGRILCVACKNYFRLVPAELSIPGTQ